MGKHEVGTPKYIANKIKAKGLQKLRWYCQMCQKQCRDENGFKCHTSSESHQRQLLLFADNPDQFIDEFSREFEKGYLELLSRQFGTKRVPANKVYQEYINYRDHLHMNATQWETLTEFVKWLGRQGKCVVDETEKGWFVTYVDRDPEAVRLAEAAARKEKADKDDNERMDDFVQKQIVSGLRKAEDIVSPTELKKDDSEKVSLRLTMKGPSKATPILGKSALLLDDDNAMKPKKEKDKKPTKRPTSAIKEIIEEEKKLKKLKEIRLQSEVNERWLYPGLVVQITTESLGSDFYMKKAVVKEVNKFEAKISVLELGKKVRIDQINLRTVVPKEGKVVRIVRGRYRGELAELTGVDRGNRPSVDVRLKIDGTSVRSLLYKDVCEVNEDWLKNL